MRLHTDFADVFFGGEFEPDALRLAEIKLVFYRAVHQHIGVQTVFGEIVKKFVIGAGREDHIPNPSCRAKIGCKHFLRSEIVAARYPKVERGEWADGIAQQVEILHVALG